MLYALLVDGTKSRPPGSGVRGRCPVCDGDVVAKCGALRRNHWAHLPGASCDPWWEPETDWHRGWKSFAAAAYCEVAVENHRADVRRPDGRVFEFQHSRLSIAELRERERFYGNLVWVFDASGFGKNLKVRRLHLTGKRVELRWKWAWRSILEANLANRVLDLGTGFVLKVSRWRMARRSEDWEKWEDGELMGGTSYHLDTVVEATLLTKESIVRSFRDALAGEPPADPPAACDRVLRALHNGAFFDTKERQWLQEGEPLPATAQHRVPSIMEATRMVSDGFSFASP